MYGRGGTGVDHAAHHVAIALLGGEIDQATFVGIVREAYATYRRQDVIDAFESKAESARRRARSAQRFAA